ncbi:putative periplasmic serine endoprotease DegP-like [Saliniradius amylolyticus]|uniref:Putative periplasmic serine endoprotease DegP-like n=1 Tax=Saliniradius amylolyticus TaxID=2183582 RepID=A0A2S2E5L9_9ALTE|nr:trypsin-like peptidase domain-containing protein [Saliniradius amylolyticus]AWL12951.1 putative periplasmic serine endoprotease DegP-like [Saliniradius amylolyticus]
MSQRTWGYFLVKAVLLGFVVAAVLLILIPDLRQNSGLSLNLFDRQNPNPAPMSFHNAINASAPAVVNIYSTSYDNRSLLFRRQAVERTSLGSGVIMTETGHILTCYHVIQNAERIHVMLQDGQILEAQQVGQDPHTDLAVLKIDAQNLPVIPQQPTQNTKVGDVVLAIGNPYNLGQTITQGIVSATGRAGLSNYLGSNYADFIQMDAVLNEGNSGGALVDSNGTLVGINNANFKTLDSHRRVKDVAGIFFAVPYELAKRVMDDIIAHGRVIRGYLGIGAEEVPGQPGILVTGVDPTGPAAQGGLRPEDILLKLNNQPIESAHSAMDQVAETQPGTEVEFELLRGGSTHKVAVTIAELQSG